MNKQVPLGGDMRMHGEIMQPPNFLSPYIAANVLNYRTVLDKSELRMLKSYTPSNGKCDPLLGFPIYYEVCSENDEDFHPIAWYLYHFKRNDLYHVFPEREPSCDIVMALFLYCLSRYTNDKFYIMVGLLFRNLRECLNEHGYEVIIDYLEKKGGSKDVVKEHINNLKLRRYEWNRRQFCEKETCQYLPLICEKFIVEYLPKHCPQFEPQLAIDVMYDFCNWLVQKPFTKTLVAILQNSEM